MPGSTKPGSCCGGSCASQTPGRIHAETDDLIIIIIISLRSHEISHTTNYNLDFSVIKMMWFVIKKMTLINFIFTLTAACVFASERALYGTSACDEMSYILIICSIPMSNYDTKQYVIIVIVHYLRLYKIIILYSRKQRAVINVAALHMLAHNVTIPSIHALMICSMEHFIRLMHFFCSNLYFVCGRSKCPI